MNVRAAYLLQILEKLGAPLLAAAESRKQEGRSEAVVVAELLSAAVQAGVSLANTIEIKEQGAEGEAVRLALAALSGPLVAGHFAQTGNVPGDNDVQRLVTALSAALTFADNFNPAAGNAKRLATLDAGTPALDDTQVMVQVMQALTPMVITVAGYSFGRPEKKMVQDVTDRLTRQATAMATRLLPGADLSDQKFAELALLRSMVPLYCEAHKAETRRVLAMDDNARAQAAQGPGGMLPLEPLWQEFDRHLAMLEVLGQSLTDRLGASSAANSRGPAPVQAVPQQIPQQPVEIQQVSAPPAPIPAVPPQEPAPQGGPFNPMAFFKPGTQKAADGDNT